MSQYDEIFIEGIKCYSTIGINNWEKNTKQPLIININLLMKKIDNNNADNINETINYKSVSYSVKELVKNNNLSIDDRKHYKLTGNFIKELVPVQNIVINQLANFSTKIFNLAIL